MAENVLIALIGLMGVFVTAAAGIYMVYLERRKVDQAQLEMRFQRAALSFPEFVEEWSEIEGGILDILENTGVDRFLLLRAWNGHLEPRWTTAMFQIRGDGKTPVAYVHFELDQDYVSMLREITLSNQTYFNTADLPQDAVLRGVYESEGVTAAMISQIVTLDGPVKGSRAQTYCSFATHRPEGMTAAEKTACRVVVGRLKGISSAFEEREI